MLHILIIAKITLPKTSENSDQEIRSIILNSSSEFYVSIRYLLFSDCIASISEMAAKFSREYEVRVSVIAIQKIDKCR